MTDDGHEPDGVASEYDRLGITPIMDNRTRVRAMSLWGESTRRRSPSPPETTYTRGTLVGRHLIDVHDMLRDELGALREILQQVRDGAMSARLRR